MVDDVAIVQLELARGFRKTDPLPGTDDHGAAFAEYL